jgi:mannosyltransferase OCH1-like enzyme
LFISQIFLSDLPEELSPYLRTCVERIKTLYPSHQHCLYTNETLRNFIAAHFSNKVLAAYDKLVPHSYKADLGRYCLLHKLGGWYFDIAVQIFHPVKVPETVDLLVYREIQAYSQSSWAVSTTIIYSRPNNPIFKTAIDTVVEHCEREYYGITPLCPTGPTVFGHAVAMHGVNPKAMIGDVRQGTDRAFVLPGGLIHAFGKPSAGGDLKSLGAKGTNNYNELYSSRNIYRR